ncbi:hypothetical protein [Actibacterium sp. 188UL27-1]|uniref:hypothetical protein n=1 Tax=Actibacterium sp. 188UL27-1 TaxID=2786961 RepID=UPI00195E7690|nr:hypothetical protein [Actibacterium sp. 188UL27-1]MBM7069622.1 hypothetical protein [Actibacterium sp. 188UL27-1]
MQKLRQNIRMFTLIALAMLVGPVAVLLQSVARVDKSSGPYLVIGPPWGGLDQIIVDAGGFPVGLMNPPLGRLAAGNDLFIENVLAGGAWLVGDGALLAAICGV